MVGMVYLSRILSLVVLIVALLIGSYTNYWTSALDNWRDLRFSTRMILTITFGWPLIGFVTPILIDFWRIISEQLVGLGGEYIILDTKNQLLLLILFSITVQTTIFTMKFKRIEDQM